MYVCFFLIGDCRDHPVCEEHWTGVISDNKKIIIDHMITGKPLKKETRDGLKRYGYKDETCDELINRILEHALPRQPAGLEELKRRRRVGKYVPLDEAIAGLEKL